VPTWRRCTLPGVDAAPAFFADERRQRRGGQPRSTRCWLERIVPCAGRSPSAESVAGCGPCDDAATARGATVLRLHVSRWREGSALRSPPTAIAGRVARDGWRTAGRRHRRGCRTAKRLVGFARGRP
jgi:hypothetical protein